MVIEEVFFGLIIRVYVHIMWLCGIAMVACAQIVYWLSARMSSATRSPTMVMAA